MCAESINHSTHGVVALGSTLPRVPMPRVVQPKRGRYILRSRDSRLPQHRRCLNVDGVDLSVRVGTARTMQPEEADPPAFVASASKRKGRHEVNAQTGNRKNGQGLPAGSSQPRLQQPASVAGSGWLRVECPGSSQGSLASVAFLSLLHATLTRCIQVDATRSGVPGPSRTRCRWQHHRFSTLRHCNKFGSSFLLPALAWLSAVIHSMTPRKRAQKPQGTDPAKLFGWAARNIEACFRTTDWPLPRGRTPSGAGSGEKKHPEDDRVACEALGVGNVRD